jgi:hypothetical protein
MRVTSAREVQMSRLFKGLAAAATVLLAVSAAHGQDAPGVVQSFSVEVPDGGVSVSKTVVRVVRGKRAVAMLYTAGQGFFNCSNELAPFHAQGSSWGNTWTPATTEIPRSYYRVEINTANMGSGGNFACTYNGQTMPFTVYVEDPPKAPEAAPAIDEEELADRVAKKVDRKTRWFDLSAGLAMVPNSKDTVRDGWGGILSFCGRPGIEYVKVCANLMGVHSTVWVNPNIVNYVADASHPEDYWSAALSVRGAYPWSWGEISGGLRGGWGWWNRQPMMLRRVQATDTTLWSNDQSESSFILGLEADLYLKPDPRLGVGPGFILDYSTGRIARRPGDTGPGQNVVTAAVLFKAAIFF